MAFKGSETVPIIRVPWNDHVYIKQMLDMGWEGVVIPQVNTLEDAQKAVSACRYPPLGTRSFGPRRAENYDRDREEYLEIANDSVICVIQIENVNGADYIEDIVKQQGIDWIIVGRWDMSAALNQLGQVDSPIIWNAVKRIFTTARENGIPTGNAVGGVDRLNEAVSLGCQLIGFGEDIGYLIKGIDADLKKFKDFIKK